MQLDWKRKNGAWVARSSDGSEARIYPRLGGKRDVFVVEGDLGGKTYSTGVDASNVLDRSGAPARTRRRIIDMLKGSAEGYIMRFEPLGIRDHVAADAAIRRMDPVQWLQLAIAWRAKNPSARRPGTSAPSKGVGSAQVTEPRDVALRFHIDTNRINAKRKLPAMNRLEQWRDLGVIEILMPEPAADEAMRGGDALRRRKVRTYVHSLTELRTSEERRIFQRIERIVFPDGVCNDSQRRDVEVVFNAQKYGGYLVTADGGSKRQPGGILGAAERLAELGVRVVTDVEACRLVERRVRERDERARHESTELGLALPAWVGLDDCT